MACFLGCFGFPKKRKRPKSGKSRILFRDQGHGSYEPLHRQTFEENIMTRDDPKDQLSSKIKKKVTFNLNVRIYEPIPKEESVHSFSDEEPDDSTPGKFPLNHRYQCYGDSYDEDYDDIEFEESDIDDELCDSEDNEHEDDHESDYDYYNNHRPRTSWKVDSDTVYESKDEAVELGVRNVRDRSKYVHSVLNPVENLTQWKQVKAREVSRTKNEKENIVTKKECVQSDHTKSLIQGHAVNSSLSNWLSSPKTETIPILPLQKHEYLKTNLLMCSRTTNKSIKVSKRS